MQTYERPKHRPTGTNGSTRRHGRRASGLRSSARRSATVIAPKSRGRDREQDRHAAYPRGVSSYDPTALPPGLPVPEDDGPGARAAARRSRSASATRTEEFTTLGARVVGLSAQSLEA